MILSNTSEVLSQEQHTRNSAALISRVVNSAQHYQVVITVHMAVQIPTCVETHVGHILGKGYPNFVG